MAVELPECLQELWAAEVHSRVRNDPRSRGGSFLGLRLAEAHAAIGWGQAPFDEPYGDLSPEDRVLLYAHFNQKGHLEELTEAFRQIFANTVPKGLIVVDLGCGPGTGALALAGVLPAPDFDYIGVDSAQAMRRLGERLAESAPPLNKVRRRWVGDLKAVEWERAPGWRPVLVIVSYLLASRTLKPEQVVADLNRLLAKLGNGHVTMLYTNSTKCGPNRNFPAFRAALEQAGFDMPADGTREILIERQEGDRPRRFRYAVFHRSAQVQLRLGGG